MSIKSHEEALRENQKLKGQIDAIEEREKRKVTPDRERPLSALSTLPN